MAMMIEFAVGRLMAMMMGNPVCRRFLASQRGVAAIEFAMIMPVLLILFLSSFDVGNAIIVYLKVRTATYELAAITNQYGTGSTAQISTSTMSAITSATSQVMAPYSSSSTAVTISQIKATSANAATVSWSYTVNGTALSGTYTGLPANMAKNSCNKTYPCYFILSSVAYTYTPLFGHYMTGPLTLSDTLLVTPRVSTCVQYNGTPATC
ncbi:MAG: TadE/TadG family type IV pilus assembly protein [Xanthobacteraceae bacterium]